MPKRKTDPVFAKAATLHGFEKVLYLAHGEVNEGATAIVEAVKTSTLSKREYKRKNPYTGPDAEEGLSALLASCDREVEDAHALIDAAIMNNDAYVFRAIADVLEQQKANLERPVNTPLGGWIARNATDQLATDIAVWEWQAGGTALDLWEHLNRLERYKKRYGRLTRAQLESAQKVVRTTAKKIGVRFASVRPGPRK